LWVRRHAGLIREQVEDKLQTINNGSYSDRYIAGISNLLSELRSEAAMVGTLGLCQKQAGYARVNQIAQKLRNTAHFAHHA